MNDNPSDRRCGPPETPEWMHAEIYQRRLDAATKDRTLRESALALIEGAFSDLYDEIETYLCQGIDSEYVAPDDVAYELEILVREALISGWPLVFPELSAGKSR